MPKFDFKPGDEAHIVQKDKYTVEGPYRVAGIRRGGANGPQALILEGGPEPVAHTDPETVFHDRETARRFALDLVDRAIFEAQRNLKALENERRLLLMEPKYSIGQTVWVFKRYDGRRVEGPFVIKDASPDAHSVEYCLKTDSFFTRREYEYNLYPTKDEAKAVAIEAAAKRVAKAQKSLDKAKEEEREITNE